MRRKIKELMNKEDGFTLVELLAVIVILGIIVAIAIPSIGNVISNSQRKADQAEEQLVMDAARIYFTDKEAKPGAKVDEATLQTEGYINVRSGDELPENATGLKMKLDENNNVVIDTEPAT